MKYLRAFIAGLVVPSLVLPFVLSWALCYGYEGLLNVLFIHLIPVIWGFWNVLYFAVCKELLPGGSIIRHVLTGASLGLLVALIGIFWIGVPAMIGVTGIVRFLPLIIAPIGYAIVWAFVVSPLNKFIGIEGDL